MICRYINMKRLLINILLITFQTVPYLRFFVALPYPFKTFLEQWGILSELLFSGAMAALASYCLLSYVPHKHSWLFAIDLAGAAFCSVVISDMIGLRLSPRDNFFTIVPMSLVLSLPICLAVNLTMFAFVKLGMGYTRLAS
jgi:hypothetical protein